MPWTKSRYVAAIALLLGLADISCARSPLGPRDDVWRPLAGRVEPLRYAPFRGGRQCWVYLPPEYAHSTDRYPVLYLNDGENALDVDGGMHVNRIAEDLIRRGEIEPIIIVAIESGQEHQRYIDYTPWPETYWAPNGGGEFYVRAVADTLKPEVDRRYRTKPGREVTAMAGESLGGLIAAYAVFAHDTTFGMAGAMSPTYDYAFPAMYDLAQQRPWGRRQIRLYEDTGYPDDNYLGLMEETLVRAGLSLGRDFQSHTVEGAEHGPGSWAHRMPEMLRFLYGRRSPA